METSRAETIVADETSLPTSVGAFPTRRRRACARLRRTWLNEILIETTAGSGVTEESARIKHRRAGGDLPLQFAAQPRGPTAHAARAAAVSAANGRVTVTDELVVVASAGARVSKRTGWNRPGGPTVRGRSVVCPPMPRDELRRAVPGHVMQMMFRAATNSVGVTEAPHVHSCIRLRPMPMGAEAASPTDEPMCCFSQPTVIDATTMATRELARTEVTIGRESRSQGAIGKVATGRAVKIREPTGRRIGTLRCQADEARAGRSCAQLCKAIAGLAGGQQPRRSS